MAKTISPEEVIHFIRLRRKKVSWGRKGNCGKCIEKDGTRADLRKQSLSTLKSTLANQAIFYDVVREFI